MWHKKHNALPSTTPSDETAGAQPKTPYVAAVNQLSARIPSLVAAFDKFGRVRSLRTDSGEGLYTKPMTGTPAQQARDFLNVTEVYNALGLRHTQLGQANITQLPSLGYRVTYRQEVTTAEGVKVPVRKGFVDVYMDNTGKVFNVNNTLRYGRRNLSLEGVITPEQAIASAKANLQFDNYDTERAELVFSSHNEKIDPVYEVTVTANEPRRVMLVLVKAHSGEVVHKESLLKFLPKRQAVIPTAGGMSIDFTQASRSKSGRTGKKPAMGRAFLCIPDPKVAISKQVYDVVVEQLLDPTVLATKYFTMYVGSKRNPVRAKADGTFNYKPGDPEFAAFVTLFGLIAQFDLYLKWGMTPPKGPIPVIVEDRSVQDNAYFDPEAYEIHIGIGTGLKSGGLTRYIAYDLGVFWHENGHHVVFLQTPGNDLPGSEGSAIHESIGDVLGDLLMDWWFRMTYAKQLGAQLTQADVDGDRRVIGKYALPPDGIRIQKNDKKTPQDKTGEPHDDGLISGGAKADLLVGMIDQYGVQQGLEGFGRLTLAALAVVPAHRVTFRDLLNAYLTADQSLNKGANKQLITKSFADHGIKLTTGRGRRGGGTPVIIIVS